LYHPVKSKFQILIESITKESNVNANRFSLFIPDEALKIGFISFDLSCLEKGCYRFERFRLALFKNYCKIKCKNERRGFIGLFGQLIGPIQWSYKTTTLILTFYFSDDSLKVLHENVRIFNSLFQGYPNQKRWIRFSKLY